MEIETKRKAWLRATLVIWAVNVTGWTSWLYNRYFDFRAQDALAMLCWMGVVASVTIIIDQGKTIDRRRPWLLVALVVLHFATWPLLNLFVLQTDYGWTFIYGYLTLSGLAVGWYWARPKPGVMLAAGTLAAWLIPYPSLPEQRLYYDKVVTAVETKKGVIHTAQWKSDFWTHYNKQLSLATIDAHMYYEPLVHPIMHLAAAESHVLLVGGDNGAALHELNKYSDITVEALPYDAEFFQLSVGEVDFQWHDSEIFRHLATSETHYDVIIVDLPDPGSITTNQYYTLEFYEACHERLADGGLLVTQSGSPYLQATVFHTILTTMQAANFTTVPLHNQVPSLGQWSWIIGGKMTSAKVLDEGLRSIAPRVPTIWWDTEAMAMIMSFGKASFFHEGQVPVNGMDDPTLLTHSSSK